MMTPRESRNIYVYNIYMRDFLRGLCRRSGNQKMCEEMLIFMNGQYAKKTNKKLTHLTHFGCSFSFVFVFLIRNVIKSFLLFLSFSLFNFIRICVYTYIDLIIGRQLAFENSNSLAQNSFNDRTIDSRKVDLSSFVIQVLNIYEYMSPSSSITFGQFIYFVSTARQTDR